MFGLLQLITQCEGSLTNSLVTTLRMGIRAREGNSQRSKLLTLRHYNDFTVDLAHKANYSGSSSLLWGGAHFITVGPSWYGCEIIQASPITPLRKAFICSWVAGST